jgi:hypothetical protein
MGKHHGTTVGHDPAPSKYWQAQIEYATREPVTNLMDATSAYQQVIGDENEMGIEEIDAETGTWNIEVYDAVMAAWITDPNTARRGMGQVELAGGEYRITIPLE